MTSHIKYTITTRKCNSDIVIRTRDVHPQKYPADIPPPQSATLGLDPVARKLICYPAEGRRLSRPEHTVYLATCSRSLANDPVGEIRTATWKLRVRCSTARPLARGAFDVRVYVGGKGLRRNTEQRELESSVTRQRCIDWTGSRAPHHNSQWMRKPNAAYACQRPVQAS